MYTRTLPLILHALLAFAAVGQVSLEEQLSATLDAMAAAAIAGDAEAYLEHVATDEPEFLVEQRAWAKDIKRIAPDVLTYALASEPELDDEGDANATVHITWNTPNWTGGDRELTVRTRFVRENDAWKYGGRVWRERTSDGLRVLYANGASSLARDVVRLWPDIKAHVEEGFETKLDHPQVVKMYPTMLELKFSIFPAYVEDLGGWNEPGESIKLIGQQTSTEWLQSVLAHEYGHALSFAMGGPDIPLAVERAHNTPWWVLEGVAELGANKFSSAYNRAERAVRHWHANDTLAEWDDITNFYETDPNDYGYVYVQGLHFVAYASERFGRSARNQWLRVMMTGNTLEDATLEAFGMTFEALDAEWRASITEDQ